MSAHRRHAARRHPQRVVGNLVVGLERREAALGRRQPHDVHRRQRAADIISVVVVARVAGNSPSLVRTIRRLDGVERPIQRPFDVARREYSASHRQRIIIAGGAKKAEFYS